VKRRHILWLGLAIYAVSFFLVDAVGTRPGRGYISAYLALLIPWSHNLFGHDGLFEGRVFEYVALLLSGWINPVFLVAMLANWQGQNRPAYKILRGAVLAMIPFCWVVFYCEGFYPREGHFVWIVGMWMALFSVEIGKARPPTTRPSLG
jgi:hypothetical protein